ncbi:TfoX/Sxy family protein [Clostridium cibarium]|uniref:TfoX/Sxy family protein n=1 Tax=Clostridium cibarium TaxID=2762247 RepID=A0ABR8PZB9_9CLOT|nr:TfoX/Sxy family protein [Clostridium cibarium]MBD7913517.1 TfoX/Sxy family protein [Clostridium cibarium]
MASSQEYLDFIIEQLYILDNISYKKMMGEYILYYREKIFGGIYDNRFLVKITNSSRKLMPEAIEELPYDGAKPMLLVDSIDNKEFLYELIMNMYEELPNSKVKKKQ